MCREPQQEDRPGAATRFCAWHVQEAGSSVGAEYSRAKFRVYCAVHQMLQPGLQASCAIYILFTAYTKNTHPFCVMMLHS